MRSCHFFNNKYFTDVMYAKLYLDLIELLDSQENVKKKKSIENLLNKLYSPQLNTILKRLGYMPLLE